MKILIRESDFERATLGMQSEILDNNTKQINLNNVKTAIGNGGLFYVIEDSTNGVKLGYSVLDKQGQILVNFNRK
jgi:hypothetical protein